MTSDSFSVDQFLELKEKNTSELFDLLLTEDPLDGEEWAAAQELSVRGTQEIFTRAIELCNSQDAHKISRGLDVLQQFGCKEKEDLHLEERYDLACKFLSHKNEEVCESSAWVLARLHDRRAKEKLMTLSDAPNENIRFAVAVGLLGETSSKAIETILKLMEDTDNDVRNWATFFFSPPFFDNVLDSADIRTALKKRLTDTFEDVKEEAIWALAARKEPEGLSLLIQRLEDGITLGDEYAIECILGREMSDDDDLKDISSELRQFLDTDTEKPEK